MKSRVTSVLKILVLAALLVVGASGRALASPITFNFTGNVTFVTPEPQLAAMFDTTQTMSGFFTFESSTADSFGSADVGIYLAITAFQMTVGSYTATLAPGEHQIGVVNAASPFNDVYQPFASLSGPAVGTLFPYVAQINLDDPTRTAIVSDLLPLTPPILSAYSQRAWVLIFLDGSLDDPFSGGGSVDGTLSSLTLATDAPAAAVPEPASLTLLGIGLASGALRRWRQTRCTQL